MMKLIVILGFLFFDSPAKLDSLGVETINGKMFIIHKVDEKETLYSIARRYGTTTESILEYNAGAKQGLEEGLILKVPYTPKQKSADAKYHTVAAKETLYSISRLYGVTTDEIKQWNNLADNSLSVGQEIMVKKPGVKSMAQTGIDKNIPTNKGGLHTVAEKETLFSIARQHGITVDQLKQWNNLTSNELKIGQALVVSSSPKSTQSGGGGNGVTNDREKKKDELKAQKDGAKNDEIKKSNPVADIKKETPNPTANKEVVREQPAIRISESVTNSDEIKESGVAELIEGTEGNRKYLALHRTAPVGTILKVRNEMNNREVFVRVMGKLQDTALTDKLIIRISKSAYDRLGAIDPKFRVEVTYYK
jgi:LysM repeat protein